MARKIRIAHSTGIGAVGMAIEHLAGVRPRELLLCYRRMIPAAWPPTCYRESRWHGQCFDGDRTCALGCGAGCPGRLWRGGELARHVADHEALLIRLGEILPDLMPALQMRSARPAAAALRRLQLPAAEPLLAGSERGVAGEFTDWASERLRCRRLVASHLNARKLWMRDTK